MGVFSTNQNRQMYVAKSCVTSITGSTPAGAIMVSSDTKKTELYFNHVGAKGDQMRSDIVPVANIMYAKSTAADALKLQLKTVKVELNVALIAGQDYILKINIRQAFGKSDTHTYQKYGVVRATSAMVTDISKFWAAMKESLDVNFSRELTSWFTFATVAAGESTTAGLTITENEQPWVPGKTPKENVYFDVVNSYVNDSTGNEVKVFTINAPTYTAESKNGHVIVDQEIFYMGERGDQYRDVNGLYKIDTEYLANKDTDYCAIDIHYFFTDSNEGAQKSEKDIYIVGEKATINTLIGKINAIKSGLLTTIA